jgi:hypothetical protein
MQEKGMEHDDKQTQAGSVGCGSYDCNRVLCAQETRRVVPNPSPNPKDDSKPNSSAVPDAYALVGHFDRIVVIRLKYKANLLEGMKKIVKEQHIQNGVILSAVGSLRGYEIHTVSNRDMPSEDTFVKNPDAAGGPGRA